MMFRRRREKKTNYKRWLALLKSGKPRLVVRRYHNTILVQVVEFRPGETDKVLITTTSRELKKYGWDAHTGNVPAAYLTGYLAGKKAKEKGVSSAVLDIGLQTSTKGSAIYAAARGFKDVGIELPMDEGMIQEERIRGEHIKAHSGKDIPSMFEAVKKKIEG